MNLEEGEGRLGSYLGPLVFQQVHQRRDGLGRLRSQACQAGCPLLAHFRIRIPKSVYPVALRPATVEALAAQVAKHGVAAGRNEKGNAQRQGNTAAGPGQDASLHWTNLGSLVSVPSHEGGTVARGTQG